MALIVHENTQFSREVLLTIDTRTKDSIFKAMKEGELDVLDNVWKRVRKYLSLSNLREEVGF